MKYLFHYQGSLKPKNQLEDAIYKFLKKEDRMIIPDDMLQVYKNRIIDHVNALNKDYSKCADVQILFNKSANEHGDIWLFIGKGDTSPFHASLLKMGGEW